ncbi:4-hydroxymandelate synthase [Kitasatospora sp. MAP12-15]|uniref:4-hydroxyphenylpyruvate dioxygenase n=1 Tax=unclassified Kitasatospora TaxID=2633591 RepID=UPI002476EDFB|nr:4-hydroxyphenylpyruvate dioxygenase [Kitasatospora sp. MAP12-44]MDH6109619.1 4-hydroxymandelate synthase [Kitasatospora sp. MAP12-44]
MDVSTIDHIEFYAADAEEASTELCKAFGFRLCGEAGPGTGSADRQSFLLHHGRIRIVVTAALRPEHPAHDYVARHGDGVAVIAFAVPDVRAAYAEAVSRGARAVSEPVDLVSATATATIAEVGGFGDVVHRLVQRSGAEDDLLPGLITVLAQDAEPSAEVLDVIDHLAVCLPAGTLATTTEFYRHVFGFRQIFEEYVQVGRQAMDSKVVQSSSGQVTFTLIEPDVSHDPGQIDRFLESHGGAGVQHVAFLTDDIATAVRTLAGRGVQFLQTPGSYYDGLAARLGDMDHEVELLRELNILVDRDHWGDVFQIFTQSTHEKRTYFSEVIDRHGAKTFGSGNIKALYEAVQRDSEDTSVH